MAVFQHEAFDLLRGLRLDPHAGYYMAHKAELKEFIEQPLQRLMGGAALRLPDLARSRLETKRNVFSRFLKNDFGNGGAWDNYWGAFYPKGSRRIYDAQLAVWMDADRVQISFYINDYGVAPRARFLRNVARYRADLPRLLKPLVSNPRVVLAVDGHTTLDESGYIVPGHPMTWEEWLDAPARGDYLLGVPFRPVDVIQMPYQEMENWVVKIFTLYFPLALLAMEEEPMPLISAYIKG